MCVKLPPGDLNSGPYPPHPISTNTICAISFYYNKVLLKQAIHINIFYHKNMRGVMSIIFSQQIIGDKLQLVLI